MEENLNVVEKDVDPEVKVTGDSDTTVRYSIAMRDRPSKSSIVLACVYTNILLTLLVLAIILTGRSYRTRNMILNAIKEDQEAVGSLVAVYTEPELMQGAKGKEYYTVDIINNEEKYITYVVVIENKQVVYCEEVE